jgi:vibriolysin
VPAIESDVMDASHGKVLNMRRSIALTLPVLAAFLLLSNCATPADETSDETTESSATSDESVLDSREGLTALPTMAPARRARSMDPGAAAIAYVTAAAESVGAKNPEYKVLEVAADVDGLTHVRLQQLHEGTVVWGADVAVHLSDVQVLGAGGSLAANIAVPSTAATLDGAGALTLAKKERFGTRVVVTEREKSEKVIYIDARGNAHVAIHTAFFNELQGNLEPAFWNHIYDASSGKLLARWNELHTLEQASGPGGNPKVTQDWTSALDVEPRNASFVMTTARQKTINMRNATSNGVEVTGALEGGFNDSVINDGHGYAEITLNFLKEWFDRNSINDNGFLIISRVHYGRQYENAFWDGQQMTYGDGKTTFYPLTGGVDVVSHEIHHGFTNFHSRLAYSNQAGGLNEGFSDIAGKAAEWYLRGTANFDIGRDVFKADRALRFMCNPPADGKSIDNAANMRPSLDPHYSSGVPNKSFCLAAKRLSSGTPDGEATKEGVKRAAQAYFLANARYWTSSSTFVQGCKGVLDAARALEFTADEIAHLQGGWAGVGVTCK